MTHFDSDLSLAASALRRAHCVKRATRGLTACMAAAPVRRAVACTFDLALASERAFAHVVFASRRGAAPAAAQTLLGLKAT